MVLMLMLMVAIQTQQAHSTHEAIRWMSIWQIEWLGFSWMGIWIN